jgi:hypothetical protein
VDVDGGCFCRFDNKGEVEVVLVPVLRRLGRPRRVRLPSITPLAVLLFFCNKE